LGDESGAEIRESKSRDQNVGRCSEGWVLQIAAKTRTLPATVTGDKRATMIEADKVIA